MKKLFISNGFIFLILGILTITMFNQRDLDNRFWRPIGGDATSYYAYLPAIFIYQDFSYSFIDKVGEKYYSDKEELKNKIKMKQPNGTVVNKTFPGVAIFYLPFFCLSVLFSWIFGFPLDGYSLLFQWSVPIAHLFYLTLSLVFLNKAMKNLSFGKWSRNIALATVVFATNVYFYVVYDNSVAHIFGFCGASILIWLLTKYRKDENFKWILWSIPLLAMLLITRPTNAMMVLFFGVLLNKNQWKQLFNYRNWWNRKNIVPLLLTALIFFIPPLLWKLQSGNWIVYSYGKEGFNFLSPHWWEFLFSFQQGWWLWTPIMLPVFLMASAYFFLQNRLQGVLFFVGIGVITYVFSSWWSWTFGTSFGQRPMIDFYPILVVGMAGFIQYYRLKFSLLLIIPFVLINGLQSYQMVKGIMSGGRTTRKMYTENFWKTRRDPAKVNIQSNWQLNEECQKTLNGVEISNNNPFSEGCQITSHRKNSFYVVTATLSGENEVTNCQLVFSGDEGVGYQAHYLKDEVYPEKRTFSFKYEITDSIKSPISCYIWNDNKHPVQVFDLKIENYTE